MSAVHVRGSHLKLIASSHVRNSLRSGSGVIFLVLALLAGVVIAAIATIPSDIANAAGEVFGGLQYQESTVIESIGSSTGPEREAKILALKQVEAELDRGFTKALKKHQTDKVAVVAGSIQEDTAKRDAILPQFHAAIEKGDVEQIRAQFAQLRPIEARLAVALTFEDLFTGIAPSIVSNVTNVDDEERGFLLDEKPALVSMFMLLLVMLLPFLTALGAFNQTAGDIGSRGLRYLLLRTERANIFLGRLIGTYLFTVGIITVIVVVVGIYMMIKVPFYGRGDMLLWLLRGWLMCVIFALPWVALCAWISSLLPIPFLSLLVSAGGLLAWIIINAVGRRSADAFEYAAYATPWGYKWWLFSTNIGKMFGGIAIMLAFSALFIFMGLRNFNRRDV